jgi:hypothetical protein
MCQIIAGAAVEPHLGAVLAGDNPEVGRQRAMKPVGRAGGRDNMTATNQRPGSTSMEIVPD